MAAAAAGGGSVCLAAKRFCIQDACPAKKIGLVLRNQPLCETDLKLTLAL